MASDINLNEQFIIKSSDLEGFSRSETTPDPPNLQVAHHYGPRVQVLGYTQSEDDDAFESAIAPSNIPEDLDETGKFGLEAFIHRKSDEFATAKANRPKDGQAWDEGESENASLCCIQEEESDLESTHADANASATSARLTGKVAVGIIIVEGPTAALQFSAAERTKVISEVQNGLGWLGSQNPAGPISWYYDIKVVRINTNPGSSSLSFGQKEALWRNPAMQKLGYSPNMNGVRKYVNDNRSRFNTNWTYCAFFTKYPVGHFAYATLGGPRLVMHYQNNGWGPDNIDRVFAHETGHIFNAPDEYTASNCSCSATFGPYNVKNGNCEKCNANSVDCIMKGNTWNMCTYTPYHLGFPLVKQRYSGVFVSGRDKHALWVNASWSSFRKKWSDWGRQNLRLVDMEITAVGNQRRYHGVFREGRGGYGLWVNATWSSFRAKWVEWAKRGLRLTDIEVVPVNGVDRYSGVWTSGKDAYGLWINSNWSSFRAKWSEWGRKGLRLVDIKVVNKNGQLRYYGVWRKGSGRYGLWVNATWSSFRAKWAEWAKIGLRLADMEVVIVNGQRRYFGVWVAGTSGYGLWVNADWQHFKAKWTDWGSRNYRLIDLEVYHPQNLSSPTPGAAQAFGFSADGESIEGMGFLNEGEAFDDDMETGDMELMEEVTTNGTPSNGSSTNGSPVVEAEDLAQLQFGPEEENGASNAHAEEDGLGGMADNTESDDGLGGLSSEAGAQEQAEEVGLGGMVM